MHRCAMESLLGRAFQQISRLKSYSHDQRLSQSSSNFGNSVILRLIRESGLKNLFI